MGQPNASVSVEELIRQLDWVRGLARALAGASEADDLTQDAMLSALRVPPARDAALRPWLSRVLRNAHFARSRSERRREARDREAASARAVFHEETPDRIVARAEAQRSVVQALFELDAAARQVLILRYYQDLSSAEIARRTGVPEATVRSQVMRSLARLRERLDQEWGAQRMGANLALAIGGAFRRSSWPSMGSLAAGLLLLGGAIGYAVIALRPPAPPVPLEAGHDAPAPAVLPAESGTEVPESFPTVLRVPTAAARAATVVISGICVRKEDGGPIEGAVISTHSPPCHLPRPEPDCYWHQPIETKSDGSGRFEFAFEPLRERFWIDVVANGRLVRYASFSSPPDGPVDLGEIPLEQGVSVHGRVVDEQGEPAIWAYLKLSGLPTKIPGTEEVNDVMYTQCEEDGSFRMPYAVPEGTWPIDVMTEGLLILDPLVCEVRTLDEHAPLLVRVKRMPFVSGICIDDRGDPVAGIRVKAEVPRKYSGLVGCRSDADGRFVIHALELNQLELPITVDLADPSWRLQGGPVTTEWNSPEVKLRIVPAPVLIVEVVGPDGTPIEEFDVEVRNELPGATQHRDARRTRGPFAGGSAVLPVEPENLQFRVLPRERHWSLPASQAVSIEQLPGPIQVRVAPTVELKVRVLDPAGLPLAGANVECLLAAKSTDWLMSPHLRSVREESQWPSDLPFRLTPAREDEGVTTEDGEVSLLLQPLAAARWVRARHALGTAVRVLEEGAELTGIVELRLELKASIRGSLKSGWVGVGDTKLLMTNVGFEPGWSGYAGKRQYSLALDAAGRFHQEGLEPGEYQFFLDADAISSSFSGISVGFGSSCLSTRLGSVVLEPGASVEIDLDAKDWEPGSLDLLLTVDGAPIEAGTVTWIRHAERSVHVMGTRRLGSDGRIRVDGVFPGEYEIHLEQFREKVRPERTWIVPGRWTVANECATRVESDVADRRIRVRVMEADGTTPAGGMTLEFAGNRYAGHMPATSDGWFELRVIPTSPVEVHVRDRARVIHSEILTWTADERIVERVLILPSR
jgi:RNA polymerase sigma factor (sigma-70 family)